MSSVSSPLPATPSPPTRRSGSSGWSPGSPRVTGNGGDAGRLHKAYNLTTFHGLTNLAPAIDWAGYVTAIGGSEDTLAESVVRQPSFVEHLRVVLDEKPLDDWKAWTALRIVRAAAPYLSSAFVEENFDFWGRTLAGTPRAPGPLEAGRAFVEGSVGEAVGRLYVERHFPPREAAMDELVANLIEAYRRSITDLTG